MSDNTCLLDTIKQYIIENMDPSSLHKDPLEGLKRKESILKMYDPCLLREYIKDYDQLESDIANTLGNQFMDNVLGRITAEEMVRELPIMDIVGPCRPSEYSSSSGEDLCDYALVGVENTLSVTLSGGVNIELDNFTEWNWKLLQRPSEDATIAVNENPVNVGEDEISRIYDISFSEAGYYVVAISVVEQYLNLPVTSTRIMDVREII